MSARSHAGLCAGSKRALLLRVAVRRNRGLIRHRKMLSERQRWRDAGDWAKMTVEGDGSPGIVTAALLVIGDEILSGRTKDKNIGYIAEYLTSIGIDLREVRVVPDVEDGDRRRGQCAARRATTYVFTTGGIGPTHDDITAEASPRPSACRSTSIRGRWRSRRALRQGRPQRGAPAHGADPGRRRADREPDLEGARLLDRQRHRHGRRAGDHAGDARRARRRRLATGHEDAVALGAGRHGRGADRQGARRRSQKAIRTSSIGSYPSFDRRRLHATSSSCARRRSRLAAAEAAVKAMLADVRAGSAHSAGLARAATANRAPSESHAIAGESARMSRPRTTRRSRSPGTSSTATPGRSPGGLPRQGRSRRSSASPAAAWCRRRSSPASSTSG